MDSHSMINWTTVSRQVFSTNAPVLYALCYLALSELLFEVKLATKVAVDYFCMRYLDRECVRMSGVGAGGSLQPALVDGRQLSSIRAASELR